jgi:hypothetical protein
MKTRRSGRKRRPERRRATTAVGERTLQHSEALMMQHYAFKMLLNPDSADEYKRRNDAIWPELVLPLKQGAASNHLIHRHPAASPLVDMFHLPRA